MDFGSYNLNWLIQHFQLALELRTDSLQALAHGKTTILVSAWVKGIACLENFRVKEPRVRFKALG